jgi:hypothetical protein
MVSIMRADERDRHAVSMPGEHSADARVGKSA